LGLVGMSAVALLLGPVAAANERDVIRRGRCSGRSDWKLKLSPEDGRIEVEFEVDQNRVGRRWRVTLKRNGTRFFRGVRRTRPPSGSFELRRVTRNGRGADRFVARARGLRAGQTCRGTATFRR
jgi:hypothetical protein